ncbi:MAG TPA: hypothetical protein VNA32_01815, partial [Actinomycetota bacterium]|nr:hypothetical protein [Actinomycetota bacterium]
MTGRHVGVLVGLLIAIRVAMLVGMISELPHGSAYNRLDYDAARYHQIASAAGRPYRDVQVEVPPIELGAIEVIDGGTPRATAIRLGWTMLVLDLFVGAVLWVAWGWRATVSYLVLGLPLSFLIYFRLDLISIALAALGIALVHRDRERSGGLIMAASILAKVWPLALLPLWLVQRRWRALRWSAGGLVLGATAWVWWGGWSGPAQVLTFRHAHGWHVQSVIGNVVDIFSGAHAVMDHGTLRVGSAPLWARSLLLAALVICSSWIWLRCSRSPQIANGLGALAAVAALLVFAPLLSDQYLFWLFPWAAIAAADGEWNVVLTTFLVGVATAAIGLVPDPFSTGLGP